MQAYEQEGRHSPLDQHQHHFFEMSTAVSIHNFLYIFIFTLFETQKNFFFLDKCKVKGTPMVLIVIFFLHYILVSC